MQLLIVPASLAKSHPIQQAMSADRKPVDLVDGKVRRNPGEPSPAQAKNDDYKKPRVTWRGLTIAIENPAGSVRCGKGWEVRMKFDYGEIVGSMGVDGDPVDIYLGPNLDDAPMVYVVHQRKNKDWDKYDEDKVMAGFLTEEDARQAFLSNYTDPRFLGPITAMPVDEFITKVRATKEKPAMIKAILFFKSRVGPYLRGGKLVNLAGYQGKQARAVAGAGQMDMFGDHPTDSAHASGGNWQMPLKEAIKEHKELIHAAETPGKADDKREVEKQREELGRMETAAGEHDHLLADIPGAKWARGRGLINGHYGVEIDGKVVGRYHAKPEDAVSDARQILRSREQHAKEKAAHADAVGKLRDRLMSGGEVTDADLKLMGLRDGSSGLQWFIPAAAEVFGISSRAVRPHIKDMIRIGHTDMGVKKEFVSPKKALQAIAAKLRPAADYRAALTSTKTGPDDDNPRRKYYVTIARHGKGVSKLAGPFDTHDEAKAHVDRAIEEAVKIDPWAHFDGFGTAGVEADEHKPGVLNERLGIKRR